MLPIKLILIFRIYLRFMLFIFLKVNQTYLIKKYILYKEV